VFLKQADLLIIAFPKVEFLWVFPINFPSVSLLHIPLSIDLPRGAIYNEKKNLVKCNCGHKGPWKVWKESFVIVAS
jgi:hypothetical protein